MEGRTVDHGGIGWAVNHLRHGHRMRRRAWPEGAFVVLITPDKSSPVTQRYFGLRDGDGNQIVWTATPADLLAADWLLIEPAEAGIVSEPLEVPVEIVSTTS